MYRSGPVAFHKQQLCYQKRAEGEELVYAVSPRANYRHEEHFRYYTGDAHGNVIGRFARESVQHEHQAKGEKAQPIELGPVIPFARRVCFGYAYVLAASRIEFVRYGA